MKYLIKTINLEEEKTNEIVYDTSINVFYRDGEILTNQKLENFYIKSNEKKITIQLGFSCNMTCNYCLQSKTPKKGFNKINLDILIDKLLKLDLTNTRIEFWGGEPLLYLKEIIYIYRKIRKKCNSFLFFTNGLKLNIRLVKFFMKHNFTIILSHDAQAQNIRGKDPLDNIIIKEAVKYLLINHSNNFSINSVITDNNIVTKDRLDFFREKLDLAPEFVIPHSGEGPVYNVENKLLNTNELNKKVYHDLMVGDGILYGYYTSNIGSFIKSMGKTKINNITTKCGIDNKDKYKIISLDGKDLTCHNFDYQFKINTLQESDKCKTCLVAHLCKSSCPNIDKKSEMFEKNCHVMYNVNNAILRFIVFLLTDYKEQVIEISTLSE